MFEVRRSVDVPGSGKPAQTYPGTNAIFGKCATPTSCVAGITQVAGNVSTLGSCQALVNKVRTAQRPLPSNAANVWRTVSFTCSPGTRAAVAPPVKNDLAATGTPNALTD